MSEEECDKLNINIQCQRKPSSGNAGSAGSPFQDQVYRLRLRRQAPEEQTYQLEISFPTKGKIIITMPKSDIQFHEEFFFCSLFVFLKMIRFEIFSLHFHRY